MTVDVSPREGAALLVAWLQKQGAVFTLGKDGFFMVDLNPLQNMTLEKAEMLSQGILGFREEIRELLHADRVSH